MKLRQLLQEKREDILTIAARHGAFNFRVFGSVARIRDRVLEDCILL